MPASLGTVLFVPGTAASQLDSPRQLAGIVPRVNVWLSYAVLAAGGWRLLGLAADGIGNAVPGAAALEPGPPLLDYCGVGVRELASHGWTVESVRLDWRGQLDLDGARVRDRLVALADRAPVHIVAHSRGGLLVRHALEGLRAGGRLGIVGKVVGLGVPHQGTWSAAALLGGWDTLTEGLRVLFRLTGPAAADVLLGGDLGAVVRSWPVGYTLLPSPGAPGLTPAEVAGLYDPAWWAGLSPPISAAWLAYARAAWSALPAYPSDVPWLDVVGTGFGTPDHVLTPHAPRTAQDMLFSLEGDGIVPARWAVGPFPPYVFTPTSHRSLISDGRIMTDVTRWLLGQPTVTYTIQGTPLD